ncbi:MAG: hypothetical protein A2X67_15165 [Ignavibacteria bacterium GWA2_55_11]|nr:MAG: hypothetical protein A2X67_15165 [Ignavibacteria bacterium GWA2_55_11]OGU45310.1 MAG: hypothetical protein A2X68_02025 [Ignavibacteria bacterium GWC2_56_12]OGU62862.1 MAG: hypothetical protein A3C56_08630 [Ignavibacteria bacterium RIFCSPHIGHO2_02_FULL_56_12]OGU73593.1 MAG: hypothetical protein A3G43_00735 [Ignavibacteria bacterium RIFCSPLOWO2_12_FULL_56_21]OGU74104.1 MAG: hypothetical protein A3H45_06995 [Ignavibacteria bacterium RIFCSPLOWO2_02_FULL_55_14]HAV22890.1 hypothetical protei
MIAMSRYALFLLRGQPTRHFLTVSGIALSLILMGFLLALYRGVEEGSIAYFRATGADAWVVQQQTTNLLRGFSLLTTAHGSLLREVPGVQQAAPVIFLLTSLETDRGSATVDLAGFDPASGLGGPPVIVAGRTVARQGEVVLDKAFAAKWRLQVGNSVKVQDLHLRVVGISGGTNMVVIQYAFACLEDVRKLYNSPDLVSAYIIRANGKHSVEALPATIADEVPGVSVYTQDAFVANNLREMRSGFLPVLIVLSVIGAVALSAIVSLLLTLTVLERRRDFAVLKAIGAPPGFLPRVVLAQANVLAGVSFGVAAGAAIPLSALIGFVAPEVASVLTASDVVLVLAALSAVSFVSALVPLRKLRTIYATEAFV